MDFTNILPARFDDGVLERNIAALTACDPELAGRLCLPVDNAHVVFADLGQPYYQLHSRPRPLTIDPVLVDCRGNAESPAGVLVWGVGVGELVESALLRFPDGVVTAWERDPWLWRLTLMARDYTAEIQSGRLRLLLGIDLVVRAESLRSLPKLIHPVLAPLYQRELHLLAEAPAGARRALLCNGRPMVEDVADALMEEGFRLYTLDHARLSIEEMEHVVRQFQPELVVTINHADGLAEFCARHALRLIVWEVDPATAPLHHCQTPWGAFVFTYRQSQMEEFRQAGFRQVEHLPLAANPQRRAPARLEPDERADYAAEVAFVGASMAQHAIQLRHNFIRYYLNAFGRDPQTRKRAERLFENVVQEQRKHFQRFVVPETLRRLAPELRGDRGLPAPFLEDPVMLIGETAAWQRRLLAIGLLGRFQVQVWGDDGWIEVERFGARYRGEAGHWRELNNIYSTAKINVDINRIYQLDIVTMRVFDVLACGGFVLAEHSDDLEELFQVGRELDSYRSLDELLDKVSYYLEHEEQRQAIAERGRQRVLADHTIAHRVKRMLASALARPLEGAAATGIG